MWSTFAPSGPSGKSKSPPPNPTCVDSVAGTGVARKSVSRPGAWWPHAEKTPQVQEVEVPRKNPQTRRLPFQGGPEPSRFTDTGRSTERASSPRQGGWNKDPTALCCEHRSVPALKVKIPLSSLCSKDRRDLLWKIPIPLPPPPRIPRKWGPLTKAACV